MAVKYLASLVLVFGLATAQYKVCIPSTETVTCQNLERDGSQAVCERVETRIDCAIKLAQATADVGYFSEEEVVLLSQQQPNDNRIIASIRNVNRMEPYAFESVAVVPITHRDGLAGLRGARYCHPGLDQTELRWSPRVLKALEYSAAGTDRCSEGINTRDKSADEIEIETLSRFFPAACRPGTWSTNATVDAALKAQYPSLCSLCSKSGTSSCTGYDLDMGVAVAGVRNDNRHIQALECLRTNSNGSAVAYAAWLHVKEYFTIRNPQDAASFSILCPNGTLVALSTEVLASETSPCAIVRQPWGAIVAASAQAADIQAKLRGWWPTGVSPADNTWLTTLFSALTRADTARVVFTDTPITPLNYTTGVRDISSIDSTATSCIAARRWCTTSSQEQTKCSWIRTAAYTLGIQPTISCQQRASIYTCLQDIREDRVDFISVDTHYGYLARKFYQLTPVKLVQNQRAATSRIAAFIKTSAATSNITIFENLRGKRACFPEYGGLAYMAFVRTAHDRGIISANECDYAKAVGEFFEGACAPGALDASHSISDTSSFNSSVLCTQCVSSVTTNNSFTCSWDYTNLYFGNNGSLACLASINNDVAFLETQNLASQLTALNLQASQFRALCRNNSLALTSGINIDDNCLLAHVVDGEVLTKRNDPLTTSLNVLLDALDLYFGYNAAASTQLINLEIFSSFNGVSDLLFKDSTIGLTEASATSTHEPARNYMELVSHLYSCTGAAPPTPGLGHRSLYSIFTLILMAFITRFLMN